ncbi:hypothetical protein IWW38_004273, partial [Coemansia aciculifera]
LVMTGSIRVTNISRHVDSAILTKLFSFIGEVAQVELRASAINPEVQEAVVEFQDSQSIKAALFLSGTEIGDRALVVSQDAAALPAAVAALGISNTAPRQPQVGMAGSAHALPLANPQVVAMMASRPRTLQPALGNHLASVIHPSIMQFDPTKAEEISRTIYVGNIAANVSDQQVMDFFSVCGPVAYVKMAGDGLQPTRFAFVEFADMTTAQSALQMNGMVLADRPLKVNHSKNAINKPPSAGGGAAGSATAVPPPLMTMIPQVPTLAAMASLPSSADPMTRYHQQMQPLTPAQQQPGTGLAWPVLGSINPVAHVSEADTVLARRLRELQAQTEAKYAPRLEAAIAARRRHGRRSPSNSSRRGGREDDRRQSRRRGSRGSDGSDDDYYRDSSSSRRTRRRDDDFEGSSSWNSRRHRDYRSRSTERHHRRRP